MARIYHLTGMYPSLSGILTLPDGVVGTPYSGTIVGTGGSGLYSYAKTTGPSWMSVNSSTGAITGTPDVIGTAIPVSITVTDSISGQTAIISDTMDVTSAAVITTAWNPSDKGSNIVLSGSNLIATGSGSGWNSVRAVDGQNAGKRWLEMTVLATATNGTMCGLSNGSRSMSTFLYDGVGAFVLQNRNSSDQILRYDNIGNGTTSGVPSSYLVTLTFAIDFDAGKIWMPYQASPDPGGFQDGTPPPPSNADIAAGLKSTYSFTPNITLFPAMSAFNSSHSCSLNTGQTSYVRTPASGFLSWLE